MTLRYPAHRINSIEKYVAESVINVTGSGTTTIPLTDRTLVRLSLAGDGIIDLEAGTEDGLYRIILIEAITPTSTQKIETGGTVELSDRAWLPEDAGETIGFIWNATNSKWFETFRSISYDSTTGIYVKNTTGSTIARGKVVRIIGSTGNNPLIDLADNTTEPTSENTIGVTHSDILHNGFGHVITAGLVEDVVTTGLTAGDTLYLGTSGDFTAVKPGAPDNIVKIGNAIRIGGATVGSIQVWISNGWELDELHDVQITTATKGDIIARNGSNLWVNVPVGSNTHVLTADSTTATGVKWAAAGGGGGAPTNATYVTLSNDATLTNERVLTAGSGISIVDAGAGSTVTISATGGGGGLSEPEVMARAAWRMW